ncbi:MAG: hypothetical protein DME65_02820 [Verrucomicrobia bacterium]|nr:MAG: hypothetical protein DME65_02820 [Verrucomicrobiota bacterium]
MPTPRDPAFSPAARWAGGRHGINPRHASRLSAQLQGSRVLEDHYAAHINRIAIAKANSGRLAYISEFVEKAKATRLVQRASPR